MAAKAYFVLDGETWESIAANQRIAVAWLQQANGADPSISTPAPLDEGTTITIPDPPPAACVAPSNDNTVCFTPPPPLLAAFGPTIEIVARSYAPFSSFGGGFEGDARKSASTSASDHARVTATASIDTYTNVVKFAAFSNESAWPALPFKYDQYSYWPRIIPHLQFTATAKPSVHGTARVDGPGQLTIVMSYAAAMPLLPSPDIDVHVTFKLRVIGQSLRIQTSMKGDRFPNAEAFVRLGDGRAVLLHHFETEQGEAGPLYMLWGDGEGDMGSSTTTIPASVAP